MSDKYGFPIADEQNSQREELEAWVKAVVYPELAARIHALEEALRDCRSEIIYSCGHDEHPIIARIDALLHDSTEHEENGE